MGGPSSPSRPRILAHRGASGAEHENSLAAFRRAGALGADGVELDVHAGRDGTLVVHHDPDLPSGPIAEATGAEALAIRLPNGETVPSLEDALATLEGLEVWVEIKALPAAHDARFLETLDRGPTPGRYSIHSFDHRIIHRLGQLRPDLRRGALLASYPLQRLPLLEAAGASVLWMECHLIDEPLVREIHGSGRELVAWTVNTDREAERLTRLGVDALCGNYPDRLRAAVRAVAG